MMGYKGGKKFHDRFNGFDTVHQCMDRRADRQMDRQTDRQNSNSIQHLHSTAR